MRCRLGSRRRRRFLFFLFYFFLVFLFQLLFSSLLFFYSFFLRLRLVLLPPVPRKPRRDFVVSISDLHFDLIVVAAGGGLRAFVRHTFASPCGF